MLANPRDAKCTNYNAQSTVGFPACCPAAEESSPRNGHLGAEMPRRENTSGYCSGSSTISRSCRIAAALPPTASHPLLLKGAASVASSLPE